MKAALSTLLTLALGATGAFVATLAGVPAAALLGSAVLTSVAGIGGAKLAIPGWLRNTAFLVIGCSLGTSLSPDTLSLAAQWPISLLVLAVAVGAIMLMTGLLFVRVYGISRETAVLATAPGALSYALALSASGVGDARAVMVLQSIRVLLVTTMLPVVLGLVETPASGASHLAAREAMGFVPVILTLGLSLITGLIFERLRMPAGILLAGMAVSGASHGLGYIEGTMPYPLVTAAFIVTGSMIGARFSGTDGRELRRLAVGAFAAMVLASALSAAFAVLVATLLSLPFGQVWVAYAPGGVEAMAAMALSLNYDPAFVAVHHLFRIIALILTLPFILRLVSGLKTRT